MRTFGPFYLKKGIDIFNQYIQEEIEEVKQNN